VHISTWLLHLFDMQIVRSVLEYIFEWNNKLIWYLCPVRACALSRFYFGSVWIHCHWFLLLGRVGVAFIEHRLSLLILFIIFYGLWHLHLTSLIYHFRYHSEGICCHHYSGATCSERKFATKSDLWPNMINIYIFYIFLKYFQSYSVTKPFVLSFYNNDRLNV
jgi:hypothetical protein